MKVGSECVAADAGPTSDRPSAATEDGKGLVGFKPFTVATRALGHAADQFQLSLTDGTGSIACNLGNDIANSLGAAGHQIIMNLAHMSGYPCPTGSYSVPGTCPSAPELSPIPYGQERCAYYREWDATGAVIGVARATAGAVTVSGTDQSCSFTVELSFAGQSFSDTFILKNGLTASPWCTP